MFPISTGHLLFFGFRALNFDILPTIYYIYFIVGAEFIGLGLVNTSNFIFDKVNVAKSEFVELFL